MKEHAEAKAKNMSDFSNGLMKRVNSGENREIALAPSSPARANVLSGINCFIRGSSNRLFSSSGFGWKGFTPELHKDSPAERNDSISSNHVIALFTNVSGGDGLFAASMVLQGYGWNRRSQVILSKEIPR
jgi:hypothetical protein